MIRRATVKDVSSIVSLVNYYAQRGEMLPRSYSQVCEYIMNFLVWEDDGEVKGCGSLHILWDDLGEIRSLAISPQDTGRGWGREIVRQLLEEARQLGLARVFTLTYKPEFFERLGFKVVEKETLPHKVWRDCLDCPKFPHCDEIALIKEL